MREKGCIDWASGCNEAFSTQTSRTSELIYDLIFPFFLSFFPSFFFASFFTGYVCFIASLKYGSFRNFDISEVNFLSNIFLEIEVPTNVCRASRKSLILSVSKTECWAEPLLHSALWRLMCEMNWVQRFRWRSLVNNVIRRNYIHLLKIISRMPQKSDWMVKRQDFAFTVSLGRLTATSI